MRFPDAVNRWIDVRSINLAKSTISGYRRLVRLYVSACDKSVTELCDADMIQLLSPLIERGCTRQAQLLQTLVSAALKDCVRRREIPYNPMDSIDRVRHASKMTPWLTIEQARALLSWSEEHHDQFLLAWQMMLCLGLRRGEMLALEWSDIDFSRGICHIRRQRIRVDGRVYTTRTKSVASARDIPIDDHLLSLLRLQSRSCGRIMDVTEQQLHDGLQKALQAAGLPHVSLHGLRHTMAAVAAGQGIPIKVLQMLMGHAHYQTTADIYAHVDQQPQRAAIEGISEKLLDARLEIA